MNRTQWQRFFFCVLGVLFIFFFLVYENTSTPSISVQPGDILDLDSLGGKLLLLRPGWETQVRGNEKILKTSLFVEGNQQKYGLYLPRAAEVSLLINGKSDDVLENESHLVYLFTDLKTAQPLSIEIHLPNYNYSENSINAVYIGGYKSIMDARNRESNFRLFIVGLSFTICFNSLSLFLQKRSEKYLLPLAALVYSTLSYILLSTFPSLTKNFLLNFLLMGTWNFPFFTSVVNLHLHQIFFLLLVAVINFILIKNFVPIKIGKYPYFYYLIPLAVIPLSCIAIQDYYGLVQAYGILINLVECMIIIRGTYREENVSIILMLGAIGTIAFRTFNAGCGMNLIPHGNVDLLLRLGGVVVSFYAIAFTVVINGIFAHKFTEAEVLAARLQNMNTDLQNTVDERLKELKTAYSLLETEKNQKDTFVTSMVHNLKTPLFSLGGYADMARDSMNSDPQKTRHFLDLISSNADYVSTLVNTLFLALRLENGRVQFMQETINLCTILDTVGNTTRVHSEPRNITLTLEKPECPVMVFADMHYLTQAVQNIADNAVRHTHSGGIIKMSIYEKDEDILLTISDNGEGISEDILPHIFERYYSHIEGNTASSGLGLTIARDIIHAHNGSIEVSSRIGYGTEFFIHLPRVKQQE